METLLVNKRNSYTIEDVEFIKALIRRGKEIEENNCRSHGNAEVNNANETTDRRRENPSKTRR